MTTGSRIGDLFRLALARDLQRVYSKTLDEPVPEDFRKMVDRLQVRAKHNTAHWRKTWFESKRG
jgi:hypothetical protein